MTSGDAVDRQCPEHDTPPSPSGSAGTDRHRPGLEETARIAAAVRLQNATGDPALQALTSLANRLLGTWAAELSLVGHDRVIAASAGGAAHRLGEVTALSEALCTVVAATGQVMSVDDTHTDPRVRHLSPVVSGVVRAYLAVPLVADDGHTVGALCVYEPHPRSWSASEVELLTHLAQHVAAQLEVATLSRDFAAAGRATAVAEAVTEAIAAAGVGTFDWDLRSGALVWDETLMTLFGYSPDTFEGTIEAFDTRVHPEDLPRVTRALEEAIATCGRYEADFRIQRPDGSMRFVAARGLAIDAAGASTAIADAATATATITTPTAIEDTSSDTSSVAERLIGAVTDLTAQRASDEQMRRVLETMSVGYLAMDADWRITYVNAEGERILAHPRERLLGGVIWELFPQTAGTDFEAGYRRAAQSGQAVVFDAYYPAPLNAWFEVRATPHDGGVALYFLDITARHAIQDLSNRQARQSRLLAAVATELAENLDPDAALLAVCKVLVPELADFAIASRLDDGNSNGNSKGMETWQKRLHDVASWHPDPQLRPVLENYRAIRVAALTETSPVAEALRTGCIAEAHFAGATAPGDLVNAGPAHKLLTRLAPRATVVLPLRGRGHTHGLLTLVNGEQRGLFTADDVETLREVTHQIGLALDNAVLHQVQRTYAERLQRSLLTELPEPDHLELVARYLPAADGAQVGGDWYDAFMVRDGSTCLVIGDVTGHDEEAVVQMAQVRNVLRGGAHAVTQPPAAILNNLDWAMRDLAITALTTAVLAKIEQGPQEAAHGNRTLRWSNAGHLPPLLLHPDGRAEFLTRPSDLLLGLSIDSERHDHTHLLTPGSTVLFFTDGLVERRGENLDAGLERLRVNAQRLAGRPLQQWCDALVAELAGDSQDDIALLAVRAHPEDRPRPVEAGPQRLPADLVRDAPAHLSSADLSSTD